MSCVDLRTRARIWTSNQKGVSSPFRTDSTAACQDGSVLWTSGGALVCANIVNGQSRWRFDTSYLGDVALHGGSVFAIRAQSQNYVDVDERTISNGHLIRTIRVPDPYFGSTSPFGPRAVTNDTLVFSAPYTSKTFIYGRSTGSLLQTLSVSGPLAVADGKLFIATATGMRAFEGPVPITFSPPGGTYVGPQSVTLTAQNPAAEIRYTLDGTFPRLDSPSIFSGQSITLNESGQIRAIAVASSNVSKIFSESYVINLPPAASFAAAALAEENGASPDFRLSISPTSEGHLRMNWPGASGTQYVIQCSEDLVNWTDVSEVQHGVDSEMEILLPINPSRGSCFFRVKAQ